MTINPDLVAFSAAFFTSMGYLPQAIKTIKTRETKSISFWMYLMSLIGVTLWLIYGFMTLNLPIILKNTLIIFFGGAIFIIKSQNMIRKKEGS